MNTSEAKRKIGCDAPALYGDGAGDSRTDVNVHAILEFYKNESKFMIKPVK